MRYQYGILALLCAALCFSGCGNYQRRGLDPARAPVSYTHLTLPTILRV